MINILNILEVFLKPCFGLVEIIVPQRYKERATEAVLSPILFLLKLFKTKR